MLAGILLLSLNLRLAAVTVGPVLVEIRRALGMSPELAGVLTSLPVLALAVFGALAPWVGRTFGIHRATLLSLFAITVGLFSRALASNDLVFLGLSALALAGIAVANVLLPSLVKRHFPQRLGPVTALYSTVQSIGMTLAIILTVPIAHSRGGWRTGLAVWGTLAVIAAIPWLGLVRHDRSTPAVEKTVRSIDVARTPIGLAMAAFFGIQSIQAYAVYGWFPTLWRDHGFSAGHAGALVGLVAAVAIPLALAGSAVAARAADPRRILVAAIVCFVLGYVGVLIAPHALAVPSALLIGAGTICYPLTLVLVALHARTQGGTIALSSVVQALGYLLAAVGPFTIGILHTATHGWRVPVLVLLLLELPHLALALYIGRPHLVEEQTERGRRGAAVAGLEAAGRSDR